MKIKVCGMKHPDNIAAAGQLPIDYMGFIFYEGSPRFAGALALEDLQPLPAAIKRVGVFVNADYEYIMRQVEVLKLDMVQLHGAESPEFCRRVAASGVGVIKAFNVATSADFALTAPYEGECDYFLFDTKTDRHGGSGLKFDWCILDSYCGQTPFFLSGGISPDDAQQLKTISHPRLHALDLNSKFETEAGRKEIALLDSFIKNIKS